MRDKTASVVNGLKHTALTDSGAELKVHGTNRTRNPWRHCKLNIQCTKISKGH